MTITTNSVIEIVLPTDPTPREQFAARELSNYLERILSVKPVLREAPGMSDYSFLIGGPGRNPVTASCISAAEFAELLTGPEGLLIDIDQTHAILAGSEGYDDFQRGAIYAVYEFLERYAGCCLAAYSAPEADAGEIVPSCKTLELPKSRYYKAQADRPYRTAIIQYGEAAGNPYHDLNLTFIDWLAKNRYNRILAWASIYEAYKELGLVEELEKRGIRMSVGHHESSRMWLPYFGNQYFSEHYAQTHPEYYRLNSDGSRYRPKSREDHTGQWIYCSRNVDCIEQVSKNLIRWIGENPAVDTIAFWPNDGIHEQCSCEKCAPYTKVENYTFFQNEVAKRISKVYPNIKIDMLVYVDLWKCPSGIELCENLQIDEAAWGQEQRKCGKPDGSCLNGTEFEENIIAWKKTGAQVVYYDYYMGVFGNRQRIIPMADEIQSIWKNFKQIGISGAGTQIECFNIWNHLTNLYTFGRTAYDVTLTLEDNLNAMCRLFGEGAGDVARAIQLMEDTLDGQQIIGYGGKYLIEHIDKANIYALFEHALAVTTQSRMRNNIRLLRMAFRYSEVETGDLANAVRTKSSRFQDYEDPTGELAYMATHFDSFLHNNPGYGIAFPVTNTDVHHFVPDKWYQFE